MYFQSTKRRIAFKFFLTLLAFINIFAFLPVVVDGITKNVDAARALNVTVRDPGGSIVNNATVNLYEVNPPSSQDWGSPISTRSSGSASWSSLALDSKTYGVGVFFTPSGQSPAYEEFWGSALIGPTSGTQDIDIEIKRAWPFIHNNSFGNNGLGLQVDSVLNEGESADIIVPVRNDNSANIMTRVRLLIDRSKTPGYDDEFWCDGSGGKLLPGNGSWINFRCETSTLNIPGEYHIFYRIESYLNSSAGWHVTDQDNWGNSFDVNEVIQRDLNVTVKDPGGSTVNNATVRLYEIDPPGSEDWGNPISSRSSSNASFSGLALDSKTYGVGVFHTPSGQSPSYEEFWGSEVIGPTSGTQDIDVEIARAWPIIFDNSFGNNGPGPQVSSPIQKNQGAGITIPVLNDNSSNITARVRLIVDRDKNSGYDYEFWCDGSGGKTVPRNGGSTNFNCTTPNIPTTGEYFIFYRIESYLNNTVGWRVTDQNNWGTSFDVNEGPQFNINNVDISPDSGEINTLSVDVPLKVTVNATATTQTALKVSVLKANTTDLAENDSFRCTNVQGDNVTKTLDIPFTSVIRNRQSYEVLVEMFPGFSCSNLPSASSTINEIFGYEVDWNRCHMNPTGKENDRIVILVRGVPIGGVWNFGDHTQIDADVDAEGVPSWRFELPTLQNVYSDIVYFSYNYEDPFKYSQFNSERDLYDHSAPLLRELVEDCVDRNPNADIDIIGHSMGGMVTIEALRQMVSSNETTELDAINNVVARVSPLNGRGLVTLLSEGFGILATAFNNTAYKNISDMDFDARKDVNSNLMKSLKAYGIDYLSIASDKDTVVPLKTSYIEGYTEIFDIQDPVGQEINNLGGLLRDHHTVKRWDYFPELGDYMSSFLSDELNPEQHIHKCDEPLDAGVKIFEDFHCRDKVSMSKKYSNPTGGSWNIPDHKKDVSSIKIANGWSAELRRTVIIPIGQEPKDVTVSNMYKCFRGSDFDLRDNRYNEPTVPLSGFTSRVINNRVDGIQVYDDPNCGESTKFEVDRLVVFKETGALENRVVNAGEDIDFAVYLKNLDGQNYPNLQLNLSSESPYVEIQDIREFLGISANQTDRTDGGFDFRVDSNTPVGTEISFKTLLRDLDSGYAEYHTFSFTVGDEDALPTPNANLVSVFGYKLFEGGSTDHNPNMDAPIGGEVELKLKLDSFINTSRVKGYLFSDSPHVEITDGFAVKSNVSPGNLARLGMFDVKVLNTATPGTIPLYGYILIKDDATGDFEYVNTFTVDLRVVESATAQTDCDESGKITVFCENFDDGDLTNNPDWDFVSNSSYNITNGQLNADGLVADESDRSRFLLAKSESVAVPDYLEISFDGLLESPGNPQTGRAVYFGVNSSTEELSYSLRIKNGTTGHIDGAPDDKTAIALVVGANSIQNDLIKLDGAPAYNQIHSLKAVRQSGTWTLYVNGSSVGSATDPHNISLISGIAYGSVGSVVVDDMKVFIR